MASRKQSTSTKLPMLKEHAIVPRKSSKGRLMQIADDGPASANSLPLLPSSQADTTSIVSRTPSKRSRLKSQLSQTSRMVEAELNDERRTSSDPGARRQSTRHPSTVSTNGLESGSNGSDLSHSISIGGKMVPVATSSNTPSPSTPAPGVSERRRGSRPRSSSVFTRPDPGLSEESTGMRRSRNSGSSSDLIGTKGVIYEAQSLGDRTKRMSANSGVTSGVSPSSPRWAGQLTHAVLELSQEINRLRGHGPVAVGTQGQQQASNSSAKPKSTSLFWNQSALRNGSVRS